MWNRNYIRVWLGNAMIFFSFMLVMPLLPIYMSETYGAGKHTIGVVLCGYTIMAMVSRMFSGFIVDTYDRKTILLLSYGLYAAFFLGYIVGGPLILFAVIRTLHGAPFGTVTVSNSTVAIDVLPSKHRAEGIGYYGLSNNLATAVSPMVGLFLYELWGSYKLVFLLSLAAATLGFLIDSTVKTEKSVPKMTEKERKEKSLLSFDRFFLVKGWSVGIVLACLSFSYGVLSTYIAIYSKEVLGVQGGTGVFFLILSVGLMISRLTGSHSLRKEGGEIRNATLGMTVSVFSYLMFAAIHNNWGYFGCAVILGLGNGHMFPAIQTMFVNLAPVTRRGTANSSMLTSWDVGIGLGVVVGGVVAELMGYIAAFWVAWLVNLAGVVFYYAYVRAKYIRMIKQEKV